MAGGVSLGTYAVAMAGLVATIAALGWGAWSLRAAVLPTWSGARARLGEVVIALSVGLGVAQVAGAVGVLSPGVVVVTGVGAGVALGIVARRWRRSAAAVSRPGGAQRVRSAGDIGVGDAGDRARSRDRSRADPRARVDLLELGLAAAAVAVVVVQWVSHTAHTSIRGMTHADTLWYHMPFAARFAQTGTFPEIDALGYEAARWFPFNAHLLHTLALLPFDRDWLSPMLNLGWAAVAFLAAWCIGARRGAGPASLAAAAVVLGLPVMAATQPGQASTDIACAALLLAAVALLLESDLAPAPLALAGAATGLAIGTKVTLAVPIAALVILVAGLVIVRRRWTSVGAWLGAVAATGSFWFLRNWVVGGSPLPWFEVPLLFDRVTVEGQADSLLQAGVFDRATWDALYRPGLDQALGPAWGGVLALMVAGLVLALVRGQRSVERIAGMVVLAGIVGYLATPLTAGLSFGFNLRYLSPVVLVGLVLIPGGLPTSRRWRIAQVAAALVLVLAGATAPNNERIPAWPSETPVAIALVAVALAAAVGLVVVARRMGGWAPGRVAVAAAVVLALFVVAGWPMQRAYSERRYLAADIPATDAIPAAFREVSNARVVLYGSHETYPLFGLDLSNEVELGAQPPPGPGSTCERWRRHLGDRYDYVVLTEFGVTPPPPPPPDVLATDPAARPIVDEGVHVVYRVNGSLDPEACPA
ncbi:hypothetical protein BH23ACT2_BH23ACT2_30090 [soil metagenome]